MDAADTYARPPGLGRVGLQVRKTPSWPRNCANFSLLQLHSHPNVWANLYLLGQPTPFSLQAAAEVFEGVGIDLDSHHLELIFSKCGADRGETDTGSRGFT